MPIDKDRLTKLREDIRKEHGEFHAMILQGETIAAKGREGWNRADGALYVIDRLLEGEGAIDGEAPEDATEEPERAAA